MLSDTDENPKGIALVRACTIATMATANRSESDTSRVLPVLSSTSRHIKAAAGRKRVMWSKIDPKVGMSRG